MILNENAGVVPFYFFWGAEAAASSCGKGLWSESMILLSDLSLNIVWMRRICGVTGEVWST